MESVHPSDSNQHEAASAWRKGGFPQTRNEAMHSVNADTAWVRVPACKGSQQQKSA